MSLVDAPREGASASEKGRPGGVPTSSERRRADSPAALAREAAGNALWILAIFLIGFAVWFSFASRLHYDRVQHGAYASFRVNLALATAPTGPTQPGDPSKLLAAGTPVAVLSMPTIGLTSVVFEGSTGLVLEGGPGHLRDTPMPGQPGVSVILGRRTAYGGPFSRLPRLHVGDAFTVTTGQGVATYRVIDLRRQRDPVPPLPAAGGGRLILVTADGPPLAPSGVLRVDTDLTSTAKPAPAMVISPVNLAPSEQALGTEPLAWLPLVGWGGVLLAAACFLAWAGQRWGRWQTWIVAVPVLGYLSLTIADQVARLLPNLL